MKYYQELSLIENKEINFFDLLSRLLTQIHLGLVSIQDENKKSPIGISFPEYFMGEKFGVIGSKVRIFAQNQDDLLKFDAAKWLSRLTDYVHITSIREVPLKITGYAIYNRYQPKINKERLARRYLNREEKLKNIVSDSKSTNEQIKKAQEQLKKREQLRDTENKDFSTALADYDNIKSKSVNLPFIKMKSLETKHNFCLWIKKTQTDKPNYQKFSTYGLSAISTLPEF